MTFRPPAPLPSCFYEPYAGRALATGPNSTVQRVAAVQSYRRLLAARPPVTTALRHQPGGPPFRCPVPGVVRRLTHGGGRRGSDGFGSQQRLLPGVRFVGALRGLDLRLDGGLAQRNGPSRVPAHSAGPQSPLPSRLGDLREAAGCLSQSAHGPRAAEGDPTRRHLAGAPKQPAFGRRISPILDGIHRRTAGQASDRRLGPSAQVGVQDRRGKSQSSDQRRGQAPRTHAFQHLGHQDVEGESTTESRRPSLPSRGQLADAPYNRLRGRIAAWRRIGAPGRVLR